MQDFKPKVDEVLPSINFATTTYQIHMETSAGPIKLELFPDKAPGHCKNMIALAKLGFYDSIIFHRVIKGFVIQGGCPEGTGTGGPGYNINAEFNEIPHKLGILSMARATDPNSAGSQFFLCLGDLPSLDNQYTVFGKAVDEQSTATIEAVGAVTTGDGDRPLENVTIKAATVTETAK